MSVIAKRYAKALFELAHERGQLDTVQEQIELVAKTLAEHVSLAEVLNHPQIKADRKKETLLRVFGAHLSEMSRHFLQLLIDKGRQDILPDIVEEYVELANERRGVAVGTARTAIALTDAERLRLESTFTSKINKQVKLENVVDPDIKGGVLVRVGDRVYDGSVTGKLARFKKRLRATQA